jgi:hypothetical protein
MTVPGPGASSSTFSKTITSGPAVSEIHIACTIKPFSLFNLLQLV